MLSYVVCDVYLIECIKLLYECVKLNLWLLCVLNICLYYGDGCVGLLFVVLFDVIVIVVVGFDVL